MCCNISRRELLCAAAGAAVTAGIASESVSAAVPGRPTPKTGVTRIRAVYLAKPVPSWPKPSLDVAEEAKHCHAELLAATQGMGSVQIEGPEVYRRASELPASLDAWKQPDGFILFNLTSGVADMIGKIAALGLPTVLFSQPFSGHDWSHTAALRQRGERLLTLATSDYAELTRACRLVDAVRRLRDARIICITSGPPSATTVESIRKRFGTTVVHVSPERLNQEYAGVPAEDAAAEARAWISGAQRVVEPSENEVRDSGRLYLAIRKIMQEEQADAVTIDCLGLFARKVLPAYPCLAYCRLNDLGSCGVCEGDLDSTLTQMLLQYAFGVPGFVSDPVIDTAKNEVIHAHCVSATKMDGPAGKPCPYIIRSHLEDNKGVSLQVLMRVGQEITCAKITNLDTLLISAGTITGNPDVDRGCRTKITTKVADARAVLNGYGGGLHRVIVYGNRMTSLEDLAALMKLNVVREC